MSRPPSKGARRRHEITLTGTVDRVIPSGMAAPAGKVSPSPVGPPDPRQLTPPAKFMPERTRIDGLPDAIINGLLQNGVLSRSEARAHRDEITKVTTGNALNARFERTTDANGHRMIRLRIGQDKVVEVRLRSNLSVQADRYGIDLTELDRRTRSHEGTFAGQVRAELRRLAIPGHVPHQPARPAEAPPGEADWHGQAYMGSGQ